MCARTCTRESASPIYGFRSCSNTRTGEGKEDENWKFRQFLKTQRDLSPDEIDKIVSATTQHVWAGIDCTACANCCRQEKPSFSEEEINRLARRLEMEPSQFIETHLERTGIGNENRWQTRALPCPFLKDNRCSVYEDRPADCRGYPYLYEPEFVTRTIAVIERTSICPIVYAVVEGLKKSLKSRRRRKR